ncbi:low temperature requirement protein A [Pseudarthrobacter sp. NamE2]|uniref:low temperature requirement protein A n=1 Tax=Pseudarthrobacter sp. NamE2 TaxID=2576838 RepID=UPI001F0E3764|nr:low temperature requirement protein A [Pseudarthrobacter sp. NamE2]
MAGYVLMWLALVTQWIRASRQDPARRDTCLRYGEVPAMVQLGWIAERYGLLAIIARGECLIGAIGTLRAIVANHGWSVDAALVGFDGTALAFGMWWVYFKGRGSERLHTALRKLAAEGAPHPT